MRLAGIWRRLLRLGARNPDTLGLELRPLAWATSVLADYRAVFQADEAARLELVEVLDTFVRAGSSAAHRLRYGLERIFH